MESPRLTQDDKVDLPIETSDHTSNLVSEIPAVDPSKISQDSDIHNAKAITHENSRIPPEPSQDGQDLSETTKSDRKSTGEAEETQSQQAQQVKVEEDGAEKPKSSDHQVVENIPESREAEEVDNEVNQAVEPQENISQENVENKEINQSTEPEAEVKEQQALESNIEIEEPKIESNNVVEEKNEVSEANGAENVEIKVEEKHDEPKEVQEQVVVENTEVQKEEEKPVEVVVENPVHEENQEPQGQEVSEPKVENIEEAPVVVQTEEIIEKKIEEEPVVKIEEIAEKKVEEEPVPVVEAETKPEEEQNNEVVEKKVEEEPVAQVEEIVEKKIEEESVPVVQAENKSEVEQNNEVAQVQAVENTEATQSVEREESVAQVEEVVEKKIEEEPVPVVEAETKPEEEQNNEVVEKKVEEEPVAQVEEIVEKKIEEESVPVVQAENKSEVEQNKEVAQMTEEVIEKKEESVAQVEEVVEKKVEEESVPVQAENKPEEVIEKKEEPVAQVEEVTEKKPEEQQKEVVGEVKVEESNKPGIYTFPEEAVKKEEPVAPVEQPVKEQEVEKKEISSPPQTRSPKLKGQGLKLHIQNNVMTRILNYDSNGQLLPDASVADEKKEPSQENSNGSAEVKKDYPMNQSLTDLLKPVNMEEPQASPIIKRNATSTACIADPKEETKEKEAPQPSSAMIQSTSKRPTMDDFQKITSLGRGSYGEVVLVKKIANGKLYALKAIDKNHMKKEKKEHEVFVEREVLMKLNHPNIIKLVSSFQDKIKLYFVLEYVSGGGFSDYLRVQGKLTKEQIIFFSAEIIDILEYLHTFGIAHRDMKPENLLLTQDGHIKCIDFGTARFLNNDKRTADLFPVKKGEETVETESTAQKKNHRSTFVGTAQYVSPEMLDGGDCGAPVDLWALGCMIYLMAVGKFPFIDINEYLIFQKIKAASVVYPDDMDEEIKDIIQKLLVKEPNARLGAAITGPENGYSALKGHPLYKNVDFSTLNEQKPPVIEIASPHKKKSHDITGSAVHQPNRKVNSEDLSKPSPVKTSQAFNFQSENKVKNILSGLVQKKGGWFFYNTRQLILTTKPKLMYFDPNTSQLKGEIPLAPTTKAVLESNERFTVNCPHRKFIFKEVEHSAAKWVEIINQVVEQLYANKADQ